MKSIIHITKEFDKLKNILTSNSLKLHYCKEDFYLGDRKISSAVHPMVSFSEYEMDEIEKMITTYGEYGISFKGNWIRRNKLHPVLYVDRASVLANSLADLLVARRKNAKTQLAPKVRLAIITIKCFTKNSVGYNSHFETDNFDFKSENEWRYVPTKRQIEGKLISITKKRFKAMPDYYNNCLEAYPLKFKIKDIDCIFVKTKTEKIIIEKMLPIASNLVKISQWKYRNNDK